MNPARCAMLAYLLLPAFFTALADNDAQKITVTAGHVNLRAKPLMTAEVVAQVSSNDVLELRAMNGEWLEVAPPAHADMWVHHKFLQGSEVLAPNVNVRAGPGENHAILGKLSQGEIVQRRGELGEWIKIAPPASASLWISSAFVKLPEPLPDDSMRETLAKTPLASEAPDAALQPSALQAEARPASGHSGIPSVTLAVPLPAPTPEPPLTAGAEPFVMTTLVVDVSSSPDPAAQDSSVPEGYSLLPVAGQGLQKAREGRLRLVGYIFRSPTRYRLVTEQGETICYLEGNQSQLRALLGRRMRVAGREFWVKGKDQPLLKVERIVLLSEL